VLPGTTLAFLGTSKPFLGTRDVILGATLLLGPSWPMALNYRIYLRSKTK